MGEVVPLRRDGADGEEWVRTAEIADRFSVSAQTVRRWVSEEGMPSRKVRRARLFNVSACDAWMRRRSA